MAITRQLMKDVRTAVDIALAEVGRKLNLSLKLGNGSYRENEGHFRLNVLSAGSGGESAEKAGWDRWAVGHGFKSEDFGAKFRSGHDEFMIEGVKPSRWRFPITAKRTRDGKGFKFTVNQVLAALRRPILSHDLQDDVDNAELAFERRFS